jgi:hypothetical protein
LQVVEMPEVEWSDARFLVGGGGADDALSLLERSRAPEATEPASDFNFLTTDDPAALEGEGCAE